MSFMYERTEKVYGIRPDVMFFLNGIYIDLALTQPFMS